MFPYDATGSVIEPANTEASKPFLLVERSRREVSEIICLLEA
jgi:hypothetical protein